MIQKLRDVLLQVQLAAGEDFSGLGLLVCDEPQKLPILPLRSVSVLPEAGGLVACLAAISLFSNDYHDGFHVVSSDWRLIRVAQYFSPPIVAHAPIDRTRIFGGRYLAALFGSAIPGVHLSGIASKGFGIAVFEGGVERHFERIK